MPMKSRSMSNKTGDGVGPMRCATAADKVRELQARQVRLAATISQHAAGKSNLKQRHGASRDTPQPTCSLHQLPSLLEVSPISASIPEPFHPPSVQCPRASGPASAWAAVGCADARLLAEAHESTRSAAALVPVDVESCAELPQPNALWMPNRCALGMPKG